MKSKKDVPQSVQDLIYALDNRLLEDDLGRASLQIVHAGIDDPFTYSEIENRVAKHKISQAFEGPYKKAVLNKGDLIIGVDTNGRTFRFPSQYLNGHSLTVGGSGSGKTTKSRFLVMQVARKVKGVWCMDFVKNEFAILQPYLERVRVRLMVVKARELKLNPLQCPDHVTPMEWAPRIADILVSTLQLQPRSQKLIHLTILQLYRQFGVLDGSKNYPTLFDLRETTFSDKDANFAARRSVVDAIDPVLMSIGDILMYRQGYKTSDLAEMRIAFQFGGISEVDKNLLLNSLVMAEFTSRVAQEISNREMNLWICCDEAARLVSSSNQTGGISDLIGLVRGTGIGLDLSIQSSDLAPSVLSNTSNKFISRCGSAKDYDTIAAAMGLTNEQRSWLNTNLVPGLFVGQVGEGYWRQPFIFRIPKMNL